jgi:phage tail sheath protein FI
MSSYNLDFGADQRLLSPLDKVNIRRTMVYVKQQIETVLDEYKFEINDETTRACMVNSVEMYVQSFLDNMKDRGAIDNFAVSVGHGETLIDVTIKPNNTNEFVHVPISINANESNLQEAFERAMKVVDQY